MCQPAGRGRSRPETRREKFKKKKPSDKTVRRAVFSLSVFNVTIIRNLYVQHEMEKALTTREYATLTE